MSRKIVQTEPFKRALSKLLKKRRLKLSKIEDILQKLSDDVFGSSLHTHKIVSKVYDVCYSSRVDMDLRVIWNFDKNDNLILIMLDIGGHSASSSVY